MIKLTDKINAFSTVGNILKNLSDSELKAIHQKAKAENSWFTSVNINLALQGIQKYLDCDKLKQWTSSLPEENHHPKQVGIVMAGNIPMVGFHDFLTVLISGHIVRAKLSSQDTFLIKYVRSLLTEIEPRFEEFIRFEERLNNVDAIIATGSDNSARYFEFYFSKIPHIIRKNRTSVAVLSGEEGEEGFTQLGEDIFQYFGLGCRNVSKIYVPKNYDFTFFFECIEQYSDVIIHHKYKNNYDYNKSIYLINKVHHLDNGFLLLKESQQLVSPIAVMYFESYASKEDLKKKIEEQNDKIQCVVSQNAWYDQSTPFGKAQQPELWDYADNVNTLEFVNSL
jgi:hypothetical protein